MSAVILAGGLGTRLRSMVNDRPKVMAEIQGRPFIEWLIISLRQGGIHRILLSIGYLGQSIVDYFQDGQAWGVSIDYSLEPASLGTGGALRHCLPLLSEDPVLVLNGDSYCGVNFQNYLAWFGARDRMGALVLARVPQSSRFGQVEITDQGEIACFQEKGSMTQSPWINAGVYLFSPRLLQTIPDGKPVSLEREILPNWVGRGLWGYPCSGEFVDLGTPEGYQETQKLFSTLSFP
ncbi:MAG: nucleotidyltransferase family protein [Nitrospirota bacterium]|nr:nucleotidyltransferase family protein [Nitrospirota bacterium]